MREETWAWISGFKGLYAVSNLGKVRRHYMSGITREVKQHDENGYFNVCLSKKAKGSWAKVHRLVAEAFVENLDRKEYVTHIDGDKSNNAADNLLWQTHQECVRHQNENQGRSERVHLDIDLLRKLYAIERMPQREIARIMGVSTMTVTNRLKKYGITKNSNNEVHS